MPLSGHLMPAISNLASLGFKPKTSENLSKAFTISIKESSSLRKNVASST